MFQKQIRDKKNSKNEKSLGKNIMPSLYCINNLCNKNLENQIKSLKYWKSLKMVKSCQNTEEKEN